MFYRPRQRQGWSYCSAKREKARDFLYRSGHRGENRAGRVSFDLSGGRGPRLTASFARPRFSLIARALFARRPSPPRTYARQFLQEDGKMFRLLCFYACGSFFPKISLRVACGIFGNALRGGRTFCAVLRRERRGRFRRECLCRAIVCQNPENLKIWRVFCRKGRE